MSENPGTPQELEIASGDKKLKIIGTDLIVPLLSILVCSGLILIGYVLYEHKQDSKDQGSAVVGAIKEMGQIAREGVVAQREMNCIIALPQEQREKNVELCRRLAR